MTTSLNQYFSKNKIRIFFFTLPLIYSCSSSKGTTRIILNKNNNQTIVKMNSKLKKVTGIKFPLNLTIINNSNLGQDFITIKYLYNPNYKGVSIELFNNLKKISNNQIKSIPPGQKLKYNAFTRHFTDSTFFTQKQLKPYIKKMLSENKDTLHIGTVSEFRKKHKELFEKLTKNDSISIQFLNNGKLGERITVPVKW